MRSVLSCWCVLLALLLHNGCDVSAPEADPGNELWIWSYATVPDTQDDAATHFQALLNHTTTDCSSEQWTEGAAVLEKIAAAGKSSIEVRTLVQEPTGDHVYQWVLGEQVVAPGEGAAMLRCIEVITEGCRTNGSYSNVRSLAASMLGTGYQASRNGEDLATATFRLVLWIMAVDLLIESGTDVEQLQDMRECLVAGMEAGRNWTENDLRRPGWEMCEGL